MRKRRGGCGCLVALVLVFGMMGALLVGLRILGNEGSAAWNRLRSVDLVERVLAVDIVDRLTHRVHNSGMVDQIRNADLVNQIRNTEIGDVLRDSDILNQVRDHGTLPSIPSAGASCPEPLILSAEWGNHDGGNSIAVTPSACVRTSGLAMPDAVWNALVAVDSGADVPGMRDQLVCHMIGAQDKPTWNLEPWRPAVGLQGTVLALCNP
jgi:hypothetical protein